MMFYNIYVFTLMTSVISATSARPNPQDSGNGKARNEGSARSHLDSVVLCAEAGNCTCSFEKSHVTVKCASVGDKLDEIVSSLPQTTTRL